MKTMVVRGHEFIGDASGWSWVSKTTEVQLYRYEGCWAAWVARESKSWLAHAATVGDAFSALQSKVREFCEGVMKNFEEVKP